MNALIAPVELTDGELDLVGAGQNNQVGLVNIGLTGTNVSLLNGFTIDVTAPITIRNVANSNNVGVGAIIQVLGGPAAILQHQA